MKLLFKLLFLLAINNLSAQITISGKIIDSADQTALPFVHVSVETAYEKNGTVSDIDGNFSITVLESTKHIKFSYVGYETLISSTDTLKKGTDNTIKLSQSSFST
jgi:hypothetical protein